MPMRIYMCGMGSSNIRKAGKRDDIHIPGVFQEVPLICRGLLGMVCRVVGMLA